MKNTKEIKSEYFHSEIKECQLEPHSIPLGKRYNSGIGYYDANLECLYCKSHNEVICQCGWEWGKHFGTDSNTIKKVL